MAVAVNTRASLIARLSDGADVEAWDEFVQIYLPLLYRMARRKGLQHADAEELGQEVLMAVSRAVHRWQPDAAHGRFRDWLFRIARNFIINFLTRPKYRVAGSGNSDVMRMLQEVPARTARNRRSLSWSIAARFFAGRRRRSTSTVTPTTWQAFWQTSVEAKTVAEVAQALRMTAGSVYIARSRVMAKLRDEASRFDGGSGMQKMHADLTPSLTLPARGRESNVSNLPSPPPKGEAV